MHRKFSMAASREARRFFFRRIRGMGGREQMGELVQSVDTLVILMGLYNLREIISRLLENGCEPHRPVALIQSGTRSSQKSVVGTR